MNDKKYIIPVTPKIPVSQLELTNDPLYENNVSCKNKRCLICNVKLNSSFEFCNVFIKLKNKNNAYMIAKGNVCSACDYYEGIARHGGEFVRTNISGFDYVEHKYWNIISTARKEKTVSWLQKIAIEIDGGASFKDAVKECKVKYDEK